MVAMVQMLRVKLCHICIYHCYHHGCHGADVKGGALVSTLHQCSEHGDPAVRKLLLHLLAQVRVWGWVCAWCVYRGKDYGNFSKLIFVKFCLFQMPFIFYFRKTCFANKIKKIDISWFVNVNWLMAGL